MFELMFFSNLQILLLSIGQVFITEITRVKAIPHEGTHNDVYLTGLVSSVDRILAILTDFGSVCPLMGSCFPHFISSRLSLQNTDDLLFSFPMCFSCASYNASTGSFYRCVKE